MTDFTTTLSQIKTLLGIAVLLILWCLETWLPLFGAHRMNRLRHAGRNLAITGFNTVTVGLMFSSLIAVVSTWSGNQKAGLLHLLGWPLWIETPIAILLFDGWMYLWHRANHVIPFLWRFHRMHHTDYEMDVTTATRFHTGELILSSVLRLVLIPLLGLNLWQVVLYEVILLPVIQFHHSNVNLPERWDRCLRVLIVSPNMHRVHHSCFQPETDSNFSSIFSVWDRLAHTFRWREDARTIELGLSEFGDSQWQTIWGMLKTPFLTPKKIVNRQNGLPFTTQSNPLSHEEKL